MIYLNDVPVTPTIFHDKTSQVWKLPENLLQNHKFNIRWVFEHEGEFVHLAQLADLLEQYENCEYCTLELPYLPYARQDKFRNNNETFALRTFAFLINQLWFDEVKIHDPHSILAIDLIRNSKAIYPTRDVTRYFEGMNCDIVCYPDKGALTKYSEIYDFPFIYGNKNRVQSTGRILNYEVVGDASGKRVLIVDDICDGGATFIFLAKALLEQGAKEVSLFVTHGIFSQGVQVLKDAGIAHVFTPSGEH